MRYEKRHAISAVLLAVGLTGAGWLTANALAPQLNNLLTDLHMDGAITVGFGLAFLLLAASIVGKTQPAAGGGVTTAILIVTACVVVARVKVVNDDLMKVRSAFETEMAIYAEAKKNRDNAIADAKADPDLNAKAPYLHRKREARAHLAQARAMPLPARPAAPNAGWDAWIVAVSGPAGLETATALLIKQLGGACGGPLAFLLAPLWRREVDVAVGATAASGSAAAAATDETSAPPTRAITVDVQWLDAEARLGLALDAGTWRGLPLGAPKRRKGVLWPTLKTEGKRTVFVGSVPARRLAGESVGMHRRTVASAPVISINPGRGGLGPMASRAAQRFRVVKA